MSINIEECILYPKGAQVHQLAEFKVKSGRDTIVIERIPGTAEDETISIVSPDVQVLCMTLDMVKIQLEKLLIPNLAEKYNKLMKLKERLSFLLAIYSSLDKGISEAILKLSKESNAEHIRGIIELYREKKEKLFDDIRNLKMEIEAISSELRNNEIDIQHKNIDIKRAKIDVINSGEPKKAMFKLTYNISRISWNPLYYFMLRKDDKNTLIVYLYAQIFQDSGLALEIDKLRLATKAPEYVRISEAKPWFIRPIERIAHPRKTIKTLTQPEAAMPLMVEELVGKLPAEIKLGEFMEFVINQRVIIPSGKKAMILLQVFEQEYNELFLWNAFEDGRVARAVIFKTEYPILPAEVKVYSDDKMIGILNVEYHPKDDEITIPIAWEEDIKCKKELLSRVEEGKGVIKEKAVEKFVYRMTCNNFKNRKIKLRIVDVTPVSAHPKIKITIDKIDPKPIKIINGIITWELELEPKQEAKIEYTFKIERPLDLSIQI